MPVVRTEILLIAYAALAAWLSALYFSNYPVPGFFERLREFAVVAAFIALASAVGETVRRALRDGSAEEDAAERSLRRLAFGVPALSLAMLALGLAGRFTPGWISAASLLLLAASRNGLRAAIADAAPAFAAARRGAGSLGFPGLLAGAVLVVVALCAMAPPTYYDSLVYHLALPAKYLQEHRVGFVPYNHYSHFPQYLEMVFAWFLAAQSDVSAQLFNVALAAALGALTVRIGRALAPAGRFSWELLLFATAPCVALLSSETYVETALAVWTTFSVWTCWRGLRDGDRRQLAIAGLFGGFAAGIKYTGVLTPLILGALVLFWPRARTWRERLLDAAALGGAGFAMVLPWLVKNYVLTGGNPVFPFLPRLFPAKNVYMAVESSRAYFQVLNEYRGTSSLLVEWFGLPFRLMTNAVSFGGGYDVTGDLGWGLPLLLLPLALLGPRDRARSFLLVYVAAHLLLWASARPVLRFLFPVFPLVCVLSAGGIRAAFARVPRLARTAGAALVAGYLLSNAVLFYLAERVRDPFPESFGLQTREEYLSRRLDCYPPLKFVNDELPPESRVLFIGDQRGYYCRRRYLAPMAMLPTPLRDWAGAASTGEQLRAKFVELGFTHLFFHRREAARLKDYGVLDLTEHGRQMWEDMLKGLPGVYDNGLAVVYDLRGSARG